MPSIGVFRRDLEFFIKRALDIVISACALVFLCAFVVPMAIAIKLDSPGPVFFSQLRWGKDRRTIRIFKLRTMFHGRGDTTGRRQTVENDPRITSLGAVLRHSNIDELPQLWNVLRGDMSLIGPRCHPVGMLAAGQPYETLVPDYHRRHSFRPGMTGLAQMRGHRGPTTSVARARQRIAADIFYVENFSLWLDVKIVLATLRSECRGGTGF